MDNLESFKVVDLKPITKIIFILKKILTWSLLLSVTSIVAKHGNELTFGIEWT